MEIIALKLERSYGKQEQMQKTAIRVKSRKSKKRNESHRRL